VLINTDGSISELLVKLLACDSFTVPERGALKETISFLQTKWRHKGPPRMLHGGPLPSKIEFNLLEQLHVLDTIRPAAKPEFGYDGVLFLGAHLVVARRRLEALCSAFACGYEFSKVYLLGSTRPLFNNESENKRLMLTQGGVRFKKQWRRTRAFPTTEIEMLEFVFEQSDIPASWEIVSVCPDTRANRPATTEDTLRAWRDRYGSPGDYLIASSQSAIWYQYLVAHRTLGDSYNLFLCGSPASPTDSIARHRDNIAKLFYEECRLAGIS